jgi:hypothetical protein
MAAIDPKHALGTPARPPLRLVVAERRRRTLRLHLFTFVVGNALFWTLWSALFVTADEWFWWPLVPFIGWAAVLLLHVWLTLKEGR